MADGGNLSVCFAIRVCSQADKVGECLASKCALPASALVIYAKHLRGCSGASAVPGSFEETSRTIELATRRAVSSRVTGFFPRFNPSRLLPARGTSGTRPRKSQENVRDSVGCCKWRLTWHIKCLTIQHATERAGSYVNRRQRYFTVTFAICRFRASVLHQLT